MTDRDSAAWRRTEGTTIRRLWAEGMRTVFAGSRELAHAGEETMRSAMPQYGRPRTNVADVAPRGARAPPSEPVSAADDAFDEFLATFEPDLPLTH